MNQEKIGKFIASCRKEQGFTQTVLAEKLGITDRAISNGKPGEICRMQPSCPNYAIC